MSDLISRQAAIDALIKCGDYYDENNEARRGVAQCIGTIYDLPSAQPEQRWIPCSERLPEDYEDVLVWFEYFRYGDYNRLYQTHGIGNYSSEYYSWMINHESGWSKLRVFAWMPLPDPYKTDIRINYSKFSNFGLMNALREEFGFGDVKRSDCFGCEDETTEDDSTEPAHWIDQGHKIFKCSNCGNYLDFRGVNAGRGTANYCPNCGAKMWNILARKPQKQKLTKREEEIRDYIVDEYGEALLERYLIFWEELGL